MPLGILLDIEGTTTPIAFVYDVLFPFARRHTTRCLDEADLAAFKLDHESDVLHGHNPPAWSGKPLAYVLWLMDHDRKSTALKNLQGKIWLEGYQSGELHGEVFPDVPPALERWHRAAVDVRIFSSGSVLAQRLLFSTTSAGDLTAFLSGYFDTTTGPKNEPASYRLIAQTFGIEPREIIFISDVVGELEAARNAGMQTRLCLRPGNHPQPRHGHETITTFDGLLPQFS